MKQDSVNQADMETVANEKKRMKFSLNGFLWVLVTAVISMQLVLDYKVFQLQQKKSDLQEEIVRLKQELEESGAP
jgi:cell division protein FtsL